MLLPVVISVQLSMPPASNAGAVEQGTTSTARSPDHDQGAQRQPDSREPAEDKKPPTPEHTGFRALFTNYLEDVKHLPSMENVFWTLGGGVAALAVHPFDQSLNVHLRSHDTLVNDIWAPAKYYGDTPEQVGLSLATYAFGRLFDQPKVSHLGMDLIQAQMLAETIVEPLKFATRRQRPDGSNYQSFPSGHAAGTFAAATVIERHLGWKPAVIAYAIAAYVATSRLHDNVHYASDVAFGTGVGMIAGRTVTRHGREYWGLMPESVPGGVAIVATRRAP